MKYLALFVLVVVVGTFPSVLADSDAEFKQRIGPVAKACRAVVGATDEDLNSYMAWEDPTTQGAKCLVKCVYEKTGIIKGGKFVPDEDILKVYRLVYAGNEKKLAKAENLVAKCVPLGRSEADGVCEMAAKVHTCTIHY
ncbi:general odorant-binding protein 19d [Anabrus simplex]|uniref:general odorant-binding protein 19d n=1 Tax=Anabrus simplex TaxID=316456 RepID=UPI0035A3793D